jgi:NADH:ubiquinone oxidoreductase subunit 5 (subunit L)/multisubunit Na+/H+ antiporter MnhA subunit
MHRRFSWFGLLPIALLVLPELAAAQSTPSFSLDTILPDSLAGEDFLKQMVTVIAMVIIAGAFITLGFGVMGGIGDVFTTLSDARRMGEWSLFMKNLGMVIAVVIVGVVLAVLIYTWLTTISINPQVTIGG